MKKSKMVFQSRTKKYENFGKVTYRKDGELIKEKGYKFVFIQKVDGEDYYVVAACLLPLNVHEYTVAEKLVEEALSVLGDGAINILLFDRGFLGGEFFDFLKDKKIDFICPTRDDQHLTRHMQGLHRSGEEVKAILADGTILSGYDHLIKMEGWRKGKTNANFGGKIEPAGQKEAHGEHTTQCNKYLT